jgi:hypothetical protein
MECLICDSRIVALDSINRTPSQYDPFGFESASRNPATELPICSKCNGVAQKSKVTKFVFYATE